jgi:hypothetical protein
MLSLQNLSLDMDNLEFEEDVKDEIDYDNIQECPTWNGQYMDTPNQARVSTLTAVSKIGTKIDVQKFCMKADVIPYYLNKEGIIRTEVFLYFRNNDNDDDNDNNNNETDNTTTRKKQSFTPIQNIRGSCKKDYIDKNKKKKPFFNAASIYFNIKTIDNNGLVYSKEPNLKIFHNGGVQMTGINSIEMGNKVVDMFVKEIQRLENSGISICKNPENLQSSPIKICLMNSDFSFPFYIKRDVLCQILKRKFNIIANFESTNYQGVNIKMFWNRIFKNKSGFGRCMCENHCNGKADGEGEGNCKRITIAPFQTGKVIITGAQTNEQLQDARNFICDVVSKYYGYIRSDKTKKVKPKRKNRRISKKKIVEVPIHKIHYYGNYVQKQKIDSKNILEYMANQ